MLLNSNLLETNHKMVRNEFLEHQHDGVLREKLEEELNPLGVYYDDLFGDITSFKETMYAQRMLMNHKPASPKVARELTEQLDVMKQFQEEQQRGRKLKR